MTQSQPAGLQRLWAGWRSDYIESVTVAESGSGSGSGSESEDGNGCVFCRILASGLPDEQTHIVWRDPDGLVFALLNAYPYATGHVLVMPVRHVGALEDLTGAEAADLWAAVTTAVGALQAAYRPDGINVGLNLGRAAGAGVPGHLHAHALPRWVGDSNFMTSVAEARVLPEPLPVTAAKLRAAWPAAADRSRR